MKNITVIPARKTAKSVPLASKVAVYCRVSTDSEEQATSYVGDALLQKIFIGEQFYLHRNTGKMNMYCVQEYHEATISREEIDAFVTLLEQHAAEHSEGRK